MHGYDQESALRITIGALLLMGGSVIATVTIGPTWTLAAGLTLVTAMGAALCTHRVSAWRAVRQLRREMSDMDHRARQQR